MPKRILEELNIDEKAERVYRALLSLGDARAGTIARKAGVKRTSVYHLLEALAQMGLVSSYQERGTERFYAENPNKLKSYFESMAILAERAAKDLLKTTAPKFEHFNARVFDGANGVRSILEEALTAKDKIVLSVGSSSKFLEKFGHTAYGARRKKLGIRTRALRFETDKKHHQFDALGRHHPLTDIRYLPSDFNFPGMMLIFDDHTAVITYERDGVGIIITSREFAEMARSLFENIWKNS